MSNRPRYGSIGGRSPFGQPAQAEGWPSWRDMRPVLLKSAGIVGLAGAIMAVVSSNALFVDPGGPLRDPAHAEAGAAEPVGTVFVAASTPTAPVIPLDESGERAPQPVAAPALPPAAPESIAREVAPVVIPAPAVPPAAAAAAAAPKPAPTASEPPAAVAEPLETASLPPAAKPVPVRSVPAALPAQNAAGAATRPADPRPEEAMALWPKDATECPRDWVMPEDGTLAPPPGCETLASLVHPAGDASAPALRKTLPEGVLDLVALAPSIPVPDADEDDEAERPAAEAVKKPAARPKVRTARRSDWPASPPPDCGSQHAYWRYVDRKAGTKEWYCK